MWCLVSNMVGSRTSPPHIDVGLSLQTKLLQMVSGAGNQLPGETPAILQVAQYCVGHIPTLPSFQIMGQDSIRNYACQYLVLRHKLVAMAATL